MLGDLGVKISCLPARQLFFEQRPTPLSIQLYCSYLNLSLSSITIRTCTLITGTYIESVIKLSKGLSSFQHCIAAHVQTSLPIDQANVFM